MGNGRRAKNSGISLDWSKVVALIALVVSVIAVWQSYLARSDARRIAKLDLRPELSVGAQLNADKQLPLYIRVYNAGPVDATQLQVKIVVHRYFEQFDKVSISGTVSELQWTIGDLSVFKSETIMIDYPSYDDYLPDFENEHHRILELQLTYRRRIDLQKFTESAFYFRNPVGRWVGEADNSLPDSTYGPIKDAAFNRFKPMWVGGGVPLHRME
jgi:hypothetical protein